MRTTIRPRLILGAALVLITVLVARGAAVPSAALAAPLAAPLPPSTACVGLGTGTVTCELWAKTGSLGLPGPTTVAVWGYADSAAGALQVPGPVLIANVGDSVTVTVHNGLAEATSLAIGAQGMPTDLTGIAPAGSKSYAFAAANAGTFLYQAGPLPGAQHQAPMGLYGAFVVRPAGAPGQAYANASTAFDDEAVLVLSEIDPNLNGSASPAAFDMRTYTPKYWLINGTAYPQTTPIQTAAGNKVLLRYLNAGQQPHTMAVLGTASQTFLSQGGAELTHYRKLVSEILLAGQTTDAVVTVPASPAAGIRYPLYDASLILHNDAAPGLGGMITFLSVPPGAPGPDTLGPATAALTLTPNPTTGAANVALAGVVSDLVSGGANVAAAEFRIDSPLGAAHAMLASDGTFDEPQEAVEAPITVADMAALPAGLHPIYVRGQDASGNWGSYNFIVLNLDKAGPSTSGVVASPAVSGGNAAVAVRATGDDTKSGDGNVAGGEWRVDGGVVTGVASANQVGPVVSLDGTIAAASMGALAEGTHVLSVRAQDALGNWGAWVDGAVGIDRSGPTASGVTVTPNPTDGIQGVHALIPAVRVDAVVTDPVAGIGGGASSAVTFVEGFIDTVEAPGTGFRFMPRDGKFDAASEVVYAYVSLTVINRLANGNHPVYVRGRDASGNWGATGSTTLVVNKPLAAPAFAASYY